MRSSQPYQSLNGVSHKPAHHITMYDPQLRQFNTHEPQHRQQHSTPPSPHSTDSSTLATTSNPSPSTLPLLTRTFRPLAAGSLRASAFNLTASGVGAGMLSLPYVWGQVGLFVGLLLMIGACLLTMSTMNLLLYCGIQTHSSTYTAMCNRVYGRCFSRFMDIVLVVYCLGTLTAYFIIIHQYLPIIFRMTHWWDETTLESRSTTVLCVFVYTIVFLLCSLRHISSLRYASLISIVAMSTVAVVVCIRFFTETSIDSAFLTRIIMSKPNSSALPTSLSIVIFAFACHITAIPCIRELSSYTERRASKVIRSTTLIELFLYTTICFFGFGTFGAAAQSNILMNYSPNDELVMFARILVVFTLILHSPLQTFPALEVIRHTLFNEWLHLPGNSVMIHVSLTFAFVSLCLYFAVWVPEISVIFSLLGATCSTLIAFIVPAACYLKLTTDTGLTKKRFLVYVLIVLAIPFSLIAVYSNVKRIASEPLQAQEGLH